MPTPDPRQNISKAITNIRSAERCLDDTIATTGDAAMLAELSAQYDILNALVTSLNKALTIADDEIFQSAMADLNAQAAALKAQEAHIKRIVGDVATAGKILGHIGQAIAFISSL